MPNGHMWKKKAGERNVWEEAQKKFHHISDISKAACILKAEYMFQAPRTEVALVLAESEALGKQEGKTYLLES